MKTRLLSILGGFILAVAVVFGGVFAYFSSDKAPTHSALLSGGLPDLIPVRDFYANVAAEWAYNPSYDGSLIAWYAVEWAETVIRIRRPSDKSVLATLSGVKFDSFYWHPYKNELFVLAGGRLWLVDPANPARDNWIDVTPRGFSNWNITSNASKPEDRVVVSTNDRNPAAVDLYTVRQDGGGKQLLAKNEGKTVDWWLDRHNVPMLRADRLDNGGTRIFIRDGENAPWRPLMEVGSRDNFKLFYFDGNLLALSDRGRDRVALVTIDPQTGEESVVADNPTVDARRIWTLSANATGPDFVTFEDGYTQFRTLTPSGEAFKKLVLDGDNPVDFSILGTSADGRFVTVARSWREQSFEYYLYDLEKTTATKIGEYDFRKYKNELAETKPVSFTARDGLKIPGFLMLPRGVEPKKLPTVIVIHGGPAEQDIWQFNDQHQFLANRGYAVLSINFRGSTGYGKKFRAAGYGQYGKAMQDDIIDGVNWLVDKGIADKTNLAVMGGSYGGYSAALAMTRDPGLFKAAIVDYGVTDIAYQMQNNPFSWGLQLDEVKRYFGDPDNQADVAEMRERSPLTHAGSVQGSVLITAGKEDRVVGFEQSEEFERALKTAGKDVTAVYFENEGHGYERWQTKVKRARLVEDFLARNLGGRAGGFDYAELAARYLR